MVQAAVEQQPAAGRQQWRVIRDSRLPTPNGFSGLHRDGVDAADLVLACRKTTDIRGVVDKLGLCFAIGARRLVNASIGKRHEHDVGSGIVGAHWPILTARKGRADPVRLVDVGNHRSLVHADQSFSVDLGDEVLLDRLLRPQEFSGRRIEAPGDSRLAGNARQGLARTPARVRIDRQHAGCKQMTAYEIDEILTLRTLALSDDEKAEALATAPRAAALLDRVESMDPQVLARLHGTLRLPGGSPRPAAEPPVLTEAGGIEGSAPWWEPDADASV